MNGTLNVNGGNFSNEFIALKNDDNGIMKITAGTIESKEQAVQNWHNLDVTGGTFNGDVYTWSYDNSSGNCYHWWIGSDRWECSCCSVW